MSFDLLSKKDDSEFRFSGTGWSFCLILAEGYGWVPLGTKKPKRYGFFKKWSGVYDTNEGQIVSSADASNLASSLLKALGSNDLQDSANNVAEVLEKAIIDALGEVPPELKIDAVIDDEFMSYYRGFIEFCKNGEFEIQ